MPRNEDGAHEITESEFVERMEEGDDTVFIEYDRATGILTENGGMQLDREDEEAIGQSLINAFIDGDRDIMHARNDRLDMNIEFTRFDSSED